MYNIGVYGGFFNPLHMGHLSCIIEAASLCKKLYIVINHTKDPDEINIRVRHRWVYQLTKHIGNVNIIILSDDFQTKDKYAKEIEQDDEKFLKNHIDGDIDVVFCTDESDKENFLCNIYPDAKKHTFEKRGINSDKLIGNIYEYWDKLPNLVKPYFVKKVLLVGSSSTGKSTLTINLANYYNTNFIEEESREYMSKYGQGTLIMAEDFTKILLQHKLDEMNAINTSNKVLFVDTDALVTRFFMNFFTDERNEKNKILADVIDSLNDFDLILFLEPDVPYVHDGYRSQVAGDRRLEYSAGLKEILDAHNKKYICIKGDYHQRFIEATRAIDNILK